MTSLTDPAPVATPHRARHRAAYILSVLLVAAVLLAGLTVVARAAAPDLIDVGATLWLQSWRSPVLLDLMYAVSWPGFAPQSWLVPVAIALVVAWRLRPRDGLWIVGSLIGTPIDLLVKQVVHRPRPSSDLVQVFAQLNDYSFPSGHVVEYTTLFGFCFFLLYALARPSGWRTALLVGCALLIALIGPSRMYLGQHWLSDVLGGYALGTLVLVPYCWAYSRWELAPRDRLSHRPRPGR